MRFYLLSDFLDSNSTRFVVPCFLKVKVVPFDLSCVAVDDSIFIVVFLYPSWLSFSQFWKVFLSLVWLIVNMSSKQRFT